MLKRTKKFLSILLLCTLMLPALATITSNAAVTLAVDKVEMFFTKSKNSVTDVYKSTKGTSLPYRLYVPANYDETKSYPLVLAFHGAGECGTDNTHIFRGGSILQRLLVKTTPTDYPCIILAPQCKDTNSKWVSTDWGPGLYDHTKIKTSPYMAAAEELLDKVISEYSVDTARLYVTGISMGGYATWDIISRNPDKFAAAIPVCGGIDPSYMEGLKEMPIWTFHCNGDTIVSSAGTKKAAELLADNPNFKYTEYNSTNHDAWSQAYAENDLLEWLFAQKKDIVEPTPTPTPTPEVTPDATATEPVATPTVAPETTEAPAATQTPAPVNSISPAVIAVIAVAVVAVVGVAIAVIGKKKKK